MGGKAPSQPSNVTSTSVTEIPEEVKPYLTAFLKRGEAASRVPFSSYGK